MKKKLIITGVVVAFIALGIFVGLYIKDLYFILEKNTIYIHGEYPVYESYEDIVLSADNIYEGTVEDISFGIYNYMTQDWYHGEAVTDEERESGRIELETIYKVKVDKVYQGRAEDYYYIVTSGGVDGYNDIWQGILLKNAGIKFRAVGSLGNIKGQKLLFPTRDWLDEQTILAAPYGKYEIGSDKYNEFVEYLNSDEYKNPPVTLTNKYIDTTDLNYDNAKDIVDNAEAVFVGRVKSAFVLISGLNDNGECIESISYEIVPTDKVTELKSNVITIDIDGFSESVDTRKQYHMLAKYGITEKLQYKDLNTISVGKTYLFVLHKTGEYYYEVPNPAQFAFATDDSNAPGGVTYSMIMEYLKLKKNGC